MVNRWSNLAKFGRVDAKHFSSIRQGQPTSLLGEPPRQPAAADMRESIINDKHAA